MPVNSRLLRKVADAIEEHPERYDQKTWLARQWHRLDHLGDVLAVRRGKFECGATGCIAGHAVVLSRMDPTPYEGPEGLNWRQAGEHALGIPRYLSTWLFDGSRRRRTMPQVLRAIADGERDLTALRKIERQKLAPARRGTVGA